MIEHIIDVNETVELTIATSQITYDSETYTKKLYIRCNKLETIYCIKVWTDTYDYVEYYNENYDDAVATYNSV